MKSADPIQEWFDKSQITVDSAMDERILTDASDILRSCQRGRFAEASQNPWRVFMQGKMIRYAAVAIVVAAVVFGVVFYSNSPSSAYAIEQTIKAIDTIQTVHFKAEFFRQGPVECWMQFDGKTKKPTHLCLFWADHPLRKIDSPNGSFAVNTATNRIFRTLRDERKKDWHLDFADFFKQSLKAAKSNGNIQIKIRNEPEADTEAIFITVDDRKRTVEYRIDAETKLPIRFTTVKLNDFMHFYRQTIAVRDMSMIEYNQPAPEGLFDVPANATEVFNEHDIIVHPGIGMPIENMDEQEACEKIIREVAATMNARDWEKVTTLLFPFGIPPKEIRAQFDTDKSKPLVEVLELGKAQQQREYWIIHSKSREIGGKVKEEDVPVKFFEFDGQRRCMIMWPD
ncbi:MAG: hypothetical protein JW828_10890 [Sedimentisphaerales bacterium]|nr:hypothetical protein [Sedimentisphaerales bacterium]